MSKHPDNPYWCQSHDHAYSILSAHEWAAAEAEGHITVDHVLDRIGHIIASGHEQNGHVAWDADGFATALTADGYKLGEDLTVYIRTNDHEPPHIHFDGDRPRSKAFKINIPTGDVDGEAPQGWSAKKLRAVRKLVTANADLLMDEWTRIHRN